MIPTKWKKRLLATNYSLPDTEQQLKINWQNRSVGVNLPFVVGFWVSDELWEP